MIAFPSGVLPVLVRGVLGMSFKAELLLVLRTAMGVSSGRICWLVPPGRVVETLKGGALLFFEILHELESKVNSLPSQENSLLIDGIYLAFDHEGNC